MSAPSSAAAATTAAAAPSLPFVEIEGVGPCYYRLFGIIDTAGVWEWKSPVPDSAEHVDIYVTRKQFKIGRTNDKVTAEWKEEDGLLVNNPKVSRHHATIELAPDGTSFRLACLSKNGCDVDKVTIKASETVALHSGSCIRVGPLFVKFLLPKSVGGDAPTAPKAPLPTWTKPAEHADAFKAVLGQFGTPAGHFCVRDLIAAVCDKFPLPASASATEKESLQENYKVVLTRWLKGAVGRNFADPAEDVPDSEKLQSRFNSHSTKWWRLREQFRGRGRGGSTVEMMVDSS